MRFENKDFANTTVTLDCNDFIDCSMTDCVLIHQGGPFTIQGELNLTRVRYAVAGPAQHTLNFMRLVRRSGALDALLDAQEQTEPLSNLTAKKN